MTKENKLLNAGLESALNTESEHPVCAIRLILKNFIQYKESLTPEHLKNWNMLITDVAETLFADVHAPYLEEKFLTLMCIDTPESERTDILNHIERCDKVPRAYKQAVRAMVSEDTCCKGNPLFYAKEKVQNFEDSEIQQVYYLSDTTNQPPLPASVLFKKLIDTFPSVL